MLRWSLVVVLSVALVGCAHRAPSPQSRATESHERTMAAAAPVAARAVAAHAEAALGLDEMRVHLIDVGQGAATLLEFSCGAILVDTGGEVTTAAEFNSTDKLLAYLSTRE